MNVVDIRPLEEWPSSETALIARAKTGDPEVWGRWHDEYYPLLYRYAAARLLRQEDAEDIAAQVFVEALKGIGGYNYQGRPILAWFYGIARNLVSHRFRDKARDARLTPTIEDPGIEQDETMLRNLQLKLALGTLKTEHKEVVVLRFLMDLPTKQVAAIIGKSEAATYSLQVRAIEALRRTMGDNFIDQSRQRPTNLSRPAA